MNNYMEKSASKPQIPILFFLISFANILGVSLSAALPDLREYFQITKGQTQNTITFYLVGCLLGTILYAPIANAIGRKPVIYIGGGITILGSCLCLLAIEIHAFNLLLIGRIITAMGAVSGPVLTNLLLTDSFPHEKVKKIYSYLMSGFAVIPALGVTVGGFITEYISWQGCFYFMLIYSLGVVACSFFIPETAKNKNWSEFHPIKISKSYLHQFCHISFLLCILLVACSSIVIYVFSAEAPFIAIKQLQISESIYGTLNLIPNIGVLLGGFASAYLGRKFPIKQILGYGGLAFFAFSLVMWICFAKGLISTVTLFLFPLAIFFLSILIISSGTTQALKMAENKSYASSCSSMFMYLMLLVSMEALTLFSPENSSAMPILYTIAGGLVLFFWLILALMHKRSN